MLTSSAAQYITQADQSSGILPQELLQNSLKCAVLYRISIYLILVLAIDILLGGTELRLNINPQVGQAIQKNIPTGHIDKSSTRYKTNIGPEGELIIYRHGQTKAHHHYQTCPV